MESPAARGRGSKGLGLQRPPDGGCLGVVVRNGFNTAQGRLVRTILFSAESTTAASREAVRCLHFLCAFCVCLMRHACMNSCVSVCVCVYVFLLHMHIISYACKPECSCLRLRQCVKRVYACHEYADVVHAYEHVDAHACACMCNGLFTHRDACVYREFSSFACCASHSRHQDMCCQCPGTTQRATRASCSLTAP